MKIRNFLLLFLLLIFCAFGSLLLVPALHLQAFLLAKPQLESLGYHFRTTPNGLDFFSGLNWKNADLLIKTESSELQFRAKEFRLNYRLSYLPFSVRDIELKLVQPKVLLTTTPPEEESPQPTPAETSSALPSFPIGIKSVEISGLELKIGDALSASKLNAQLQAQWKNKSLHVEKANFSFDSFSGYEQNLERVQFGVDSPFVLSCLLCDKPVIDKKTSLSVQIGSFQSAFAQFKDAEVGLSVKPDGQLGYRLSTQNLLYKQLSPKPFRFQVFGNGAIEQPNTWVRSRLIVNETEIADLKLSGENHKVSVELKSLSDGQLWTRFALLESLKTLSDKIQLEAKVQIEEQQKKLWKLWRFHEAFRVTSRLSVKNSAAKNSPIKFSTLSLDGGGLVSQLQLNEFSAKMEMDEAVTQQGAISEVRSQIDLADQGKKISMLFSGQCDLPFLKAAEGCAGQLSSKNINPKTFDFLLNFHLSDQKVFDSQIIWEQAPEAWKFRYRGQLLFGKMSSFRWPLPMVNPDQSLQMRGDAEIIGESLSFAALSQWKSQSGRLKGEFELSDSGKPVDGFHLQSPWLSEFSFEMQTWDALKVQWKTSLQSARYQSWRLKDFYGESELHKSGSEIQLRQLKLHSQQKKISFEADGSLKQKDGKFDARLAIAPGKTTTIAKDLQIRGQVQIPLTLSVTNGNEFEIDGELVFKKFGVRLQDNHISGMSGKLPFSELISWDENAIRFDSLIVRNPFHRVDFQKMLPLLDRSQKLVIDEISFEKKLLGPLQLYAQVDQNLLSLNRFNLQTPSGQIDGEMHIDILPSQFSLSLLARLQNLRFDELLPPSMVGYRSASQDPFSGRIGLVTDLKKSTVEGRIDITDMTPRQILTLLDIVDPEYENAQLTTVRGLLGRGTVPENLSMALHEGLLDLKADIPLSPVEEVKSIPVSGLIRSGFATISQTLNKVPLK